MPAIPTRPTCLAQWGDDPSAFCHVLEDELDLIEQRRRHVEDQSADDRDALHARPIAADAHVQAHFALANKPERAMSTA